MSSLLQADIRPGDRVASYSSNCIVSCPLIISEAKSLPFLPKENVAASLAVSAVGGIWVSVSADFGPDAALARSVPHVCTSTYHSTPDFIIKTCVF